MNDAAARPAEDEARPRRACGSLRLAGIERRFRQGDAWLEVLRGVELVGAGQVMALMGPRLGQVDPARIAGLLERPDRGDVCRAGVRRLADAQHADQRDHLGFVYQFHHLLPEFSALENVMLPQDAGRRRPCQRPSARA